MKRVIFLLSLLFTLIGLMIGCSEDSQKHSLTPDDTNNITVNSRTDADIPESLNPNMVTFRLTLFDAPAPEGIEALNIHIVEAAIHHEENGWIRWNDIDTVVDFLQLVNGVALHLIEDTIAPGMYSQLRLVLGDDNSIVIDSVEHPLKIPSGQQTGIKLNLHDSLMAGQFVELYVDFDVMKSVLSTGNGYKLKPTYKLFQRDVSAMLGGMVTDSMGNPRAGLFVNAMSGQYATTTATDSFGFYMFMLPAGTYDIFMDVDSPLVVDMYYSGVTINPGDSLSGYNFTVNEQPLFEIVFDTMIDTNVRQDTVNDSTIVFDTIIDTMIIIDTVPIDSIIIDTFPPDSTFDTLIDTFPPDTTWDTLIDTFPWDSNFDTFPPDSGWDTLLDSFPWDTFPWDTHPWDTFHDSCPHDSFWDSMHDSFPWDSMYDSFPWDSLPDSFPWDTLLDSFPLDSLIDTVPPDSVEFDTTGDSLS